MEQSFSNQDLTPDEIKKFIIINTALIGIVLVVIVLGLLSLAH